MAFMTKGTVQNCLEQAENNKLVKDPSCGFRTSVQKFNGRKILFLYFIFLSVLSL